MGFATGFRGFVIGTSALCGVAVFQPAIAQQAAAPVEAPSPPVKSGEIKLRAASPAPAKSPESWAKLGDKWTLANVSQPTLTPFFPPEGKANGTAIIVAPGGGFMMLSMESEGYEVAEWLASNGVTAFVLKYRLVDTPADPAARVREMMRRIGAPAEIPKLLADGTAIATEDAMEAMRVVRANATKWKIDPKRVGFMGFSAGALTTLGLVNANDASTMPDFVAPIYGPIGTPEKPLPAAVPPMWVSLAADDPLFGKSDLGLINAWREKGGAVEFHFYEKGGHGYGFAGTKGTTSTLWTAEYLAWLRARGLVASN